MPIAFGQLEAVETSSFAEAGSCRTGNPVAPIKLSTIKDHYSIRGNAILAARKPEKIGFYTLRGQLDQRERDFHDNDDSALRRLQQYHSRPQNAVCLINYNLNNSPASDASKANDVTITGRGQNDPLASILKWILAHRDDFQHQIAERLLKIVGQRSLIRQVGLGLQYPSRDERGWLLAACKFQGIVYITHFDVDDEFDGQHESQGPTDQTRWANQFKNLMTTGTASECGEQVNEAFKVVMRYKFNGGLGFLYDVGIDGYDERFGGRDKVPENCYECKLFREPKSKLLRQQIRDEYGDWWLSAHFKGERGIIVGCCNSSDGKLKACHAIETTELIKDGSFTPAVVVGCVDEFLQQLCEKVVRKEEDYAQYLLRWQPTWGGTIKVAEIKPDSKYRVLPEWFTEAMLKKAIEQETENNGKAESKPEN